MTLFCAADQGPSKYLAEVISIFPGESCYVGGKSSAHIFEQTKALPFTKGIEKDVRLVVTGTSLGNENTSLDKQFIRWAKTHNLPAVAVIEHWSWYRKRFEIEKSELLLPDYILVNDEIALQGAISDGLPASILRIVGNPYLERLSNIRNENRSIAEIKKTNNLPQDKRLIFFISEALGATFKKGTSDYLGYDEFKVLQSIISNLGVRDHLIIKLHPEESAEKYHSFLSNHVSILKECSVHDIAAIGDKIIGMASMLLLELALFRKDIISYRPNAGKTFIGEDVFVTVPAKTGLEIKYLLDNHVIARHGLNEYFQGSGNRIVNFLLSIQK